MFFFPSCHAVLYYNIKLASYSGFSFRVYALLFSDYECSSVVTDIAIPSQDVQSAALMG